MCGRHLDVDDRDIGLREADAAQQAGRVSRLADDVDAGLGEQPLKPVTEQQFVVGDYDPHGITARTAMAPLLLWISSVPSSA